MGLKTEVFQMRLNLPTGREEKGQNTDGVCNRPQLRNGLKNSGNPTFHGGEKMDNQRNLTAVVREEGKSNPTSCGNDCTIRVMGRRDVKTTGTTKTQHRRVTAPGRGPVCMPREVKKRCPEKVQRTRGQRGGRSPRDQHYGLSKNNQKKGVSFIQIRES